MRLVDEVQREALLKAESRHQLNRSWSSTTKEECGGLSFCSSMIIPKVEEMLKKKENEKK